MTDPYAAELEELFTRFNLPRDPDVEDPLRAELDRRGLRVEQTQRVDLPKELDQAVRLLDGSGIEVAYAVGEHPRQSAIRALRRLLEGKQGREI